jgi:beta-exotoxin I transport system permease protein
VTALSFAAVLRRSLAQYAKVGLALLTLLAGFQTAVVLQAATIQEAQYARMAELMPRFLQRGLGGMVSVVTSFTGVVTGGFYHPGIVIITALVAVYLATEPAHDVELGLVDLVLARPVPRHWLITRSLLVVLLGTTLAGAVMGTATLVALQLFAPPGVTWPRTGTVMSLAIHLVALAWCCGSMGLAVAAGARRRSTAFAVVGTLTVLLYLVDFLALAWPPMRHFAWLSPFYYDHAIPILAGVAHPWRNLLVLGSATTVFAAAAYWRFNRRDV